MGFTVPGTIQRLSEKVLASKTSIENTDKGWKVRQGHREEK